MPTLYQEMSIQFGDDEPTTYWLCKFLARNVKNFVIVFHHANLHIYSFYPPLTELPYSTLNLTLSDGVLIDHKFNFILFIDTSHYDFYFYLSWVFTSDLVFPMAFYTLWPQNYITFHKSKYKPPCHVFCSVASLEKIAWRLYLTKTITHRKRNKTERQQDIKIICTAVRDENNKQHIFGINEKNRTVCTFFIFWNNIPF